MKRYNITVPRKYMHNGVEKTSWSIVGNLIHFPATHEKPDSFILELGMFPNLTFKVFEQQSREQVSQQRPVQQMAPKKELPVIDRTEQEELAKHDAKIKEIEYPTEDINPDDIPF